MKKGNNKKVKVARELEKGSKARTDRNGTWFKRDTIQLSNKK